MLLTYDAFSEIGFLLRKTGGGMRQRQLKVDITLATASGDLIEARIQHFARGGIELITTTPLPLGDHFGFKIPDADGARFLFCEVCSCRMTETAFVLNASFLNQEMPSGHRLGMMN